MNKYGKADEYRRSVIEGMRAMKAEMVKPKPPEPTCFCGGEAYLAVSKNGRTTVFCRQGARVMRDSERTR